MKGINVMNDKPAVHMPNNNPYQRLSNSIASAYGYKVQESHYTPINEFHIGDNAIVLTKKGEPIMSGTIADLNEEGIMIGDSWYYADMHNFRMF
jgi:hypothetical protein